MFNSGTEDPEPDPYIFADLDPDLSVFLRISAHISGDLNPGLVGVYPPHFLYKLGA
jgi:hypothetical protein